MQGGNLIRSINIQENVLQIEHLPCGNFIVVISQDREDYPTNVRLSLIFEEIIVAQVAVRASDPQKLRPGRMLLDYEYHQNQQGGGQ